MRCNARGYILLSVLLVLLILSVSVLYAARESLWLNRVVVSLRDQLQLALFIDETLFRVEQLILALPVALTPQEIGHCAQFPCVFVMQEANVFFEQDLAQWQDASLATPLNLSKSDYPAWVIVEHLKTTVEEDTLLMHQYFRSTCLLATTNLKTQLQMQATWKKTTLNGNMIQTPLIRLAWRHY